MTDLHDKVALVTGSGRGIGRAIAERYARLGACVIVNYSKDEHAAAATVGAIEDFGGRATAIRADVSNLAEQQAMFHHALEIYGRLDIVVANGRIIYVGSSTTTFPTPGHGLYVGSKVAGEALVQVLSKEIGHRGVTVNSLLPTATEAAGVYTDEVSETVQEFVRTQRPIQRMGTVDDVADVAEFLAGDLAGFISGQRILVSGGAPA